MAECLARIEVTQDSLNAYRIVRGAAALAEAYAADRELAAGGGPTVARPANSEPLLVSVAARLEAESGRHERRPPQAPATDSPVA